MCLQRIRLGTDLLASLEGFLQGVALQLNLYPWENSDRLESHQKLQRTDEKRRTPGNSKGRFPGKDPGKRRGMPGNRGKTMLFQARLGAFVGSRPADPPQPTRCTSILKSRTHMVSGPLPLRSTAASEIPKRKPTRCHRRRSLHPPSLPAGNSAATRSIPDVTGH